MEIKKLSDLKGYADGVESSALASIAIFAMRRAKRQDVPIEQAFEDIQKEAGGFHNLLSCQIRAEAKKQGIELALQAAELRAVHLMDKNLSARAAFLKAEAAENIGAKVDLYREPVQRWVEQDPAGAEAFLHHAEEVESFLRKNLTAGDRGSLAEASELHRSLYSIEAIRSTVETTLEASKQSERELSR